MPQQLSTPGGSSSPILPSPSMSSWSSQSRNPVALRLYKVIGTSYNDQATKDALRTLSEIYSGPLTAVTSLKGKQVQKDARAEDSDSDEETSFSQRSALKGTVSVDSLPGDSTAKARKYLRRDMERKLAESSRQFLDAFGEVDQKLNELQQHISAMRVRCDEAETQLQSTREASKTLLDSAAALRGERQEVETRISIVSLFLRQFTLDDDEAESLASRDIPVGPRFFAAMDKIDRIRNDCRILMSGEDGPTKAGSDIMASTSSYLEQGYERIFKWCSFEFRQMGRDAQLEVSSTMRAAVRRLRERPELLAEAINFLSQTRQTTLLNAFLEALTRGGPSGLPRPIELHAHDPLRYIGDMLAWVHQAIAAEREFLESLFGMKDDQRMVGSVRAFAKSEEEDWVRELMDTAVVRLSVPLKARILQTVRSQESSIISYKIANLLQFYLLTMRRTVGDEALIVQRLQEITDVGYKVFYEAIEAQGRALLRIPLDLEDQEVTTPPSILDHTQILREILSVYNSSLVGDEDAEVRDAGVRRVLDTLVDPAVEMCAAAAEEKKRARPRWDKAVFVLNCLTYLQSVLEPFSFTDDKRTAIQKIVDEQIQALIDEHYQNILNDAGLRDVIATVVSRKSSEPLSRISITEPAHLQLTLRHFSQWLSGLEVVHSPRLARLTVQRLAAQVHQAALERLAQAYQRLCDEVKKPENKYEAASTLLGSERPFGQVHALWQIFGLQESNDT